MASQMYEEQVMSDMIETMFTKRRVNGTTTGSKCNDAKTISHKRLTGLLQRQTIEDCVLLLDAIDKRLKAPPYKKQGLIRIINDDE